MKRDVSPRQCDEDPIAVYLGQAIHYANMSMYYAEIFKGCKNDNFLFQIFDIFLIIAQNIDRGHTFEPPQ